MVQLLKDGAVTQEYAYDAYGYINADEFGIQAPFYGYNGEEQNPFTGLQYLRARYYAPQNGGFITQDSFSGVLTNALSQNRYTYAHNNPVNYADPSGHSIWDSIKNGVTNAVNSVKNFVSSVANKVSSAVSSAVNAVKSAVTGTTTKTVANTSSAVKKSYTNTAVRQKIGSYAGGAAAAAAGSVSTSYSNSVVNGVIADSRIPFTNAAGETRLLPGHFADMKASAQTFTLHGCLIEERLSEQAGWGGLAAMALSSDAALGSEGLAQVISDLLAGYGITSSVWAEAGWAVLGKALGPIFLVLSLSGDMDQRIQERLAEYEKKESAEKSPVADQSTPANPPPNGNKKPDEDKRSDHLQFGSDTKSEAKLRRQMKSRGWTEQSIRDTVDSPYTTRNSTNLATGNPATVYYTEGGGYVIVDNVTYEIVQVSNLFDPAWIPDPNIINPYIP